MPPDRFSSNQTLLCRSCGAATRGVPGQVAMCRRCYKTLDPRDVEGAAHLPPPDAPGERPPFRVPAPVGWALGLGALVPVAVWVFHNVRL